MSRCFEDDVPCDISEVLAIAEPAEDTIYWTSKIDDCTLVKELDRCESENKSRVVSMA